MKLIIDIPEEIVTAIQNGQDYRYDIHTAIAQGKPYDTSGDLISREALKNHILEIFDEEVKYDKKWAVGLKYSLKLIDNAPTVGRPQGEQIAWEQGYECGRNEKRSQGEWIDTGSGQECNKCHEIQYGYDSFRNFCPNCGAEMQRAVRNDDKEPNYTSISTGYATYSAEDIRTCSYCKHHNKGAGSLHSACRDCINFNRWEKVDA